MNINSLVSAALGLCIGAVIGRAYFEKQWLIMFLTIIAAVLHVVMLEVTP